MPGDEGDIVTERKELLANRTDQGRVIAARKVGSPDRSGEQDVPNDGHLRLGMEEHHMTRRVTRCVNNLQDLFANRDGITVLEPAIRFEGLTAGKTEHAALVGHTLDPEQVVTLRPLDRHIQLARKLRRAAGVVDVSVRDQDLLDRHAELFGGRKNMIEITARIDYRGASGLLAPDDAAVLLKRCDGDNAAVDHGRVQW